MCTVSVSCPDSSYYENCPGPNPISRLCVYRNGTLYAAEILNSQLFLSAYIFNLQNEFLLTFCKFASVSFEPCHFRHARWSDPNIAFHCTDQPDQSRPVEGMQPWCLARSHCIFLKFTGTTVSVTDTMFLFAKISKFSAQRLNFLKIYMHTCYKRQVVIKQCWWIGDQVISGPEVDEFGT